jgi:hypothetical protein
MEKTLKLYTYVDGVNDTPFPQGAEEPLEIGAFRYDAKRMGGAPTITASVDYPSCLDNEWTNNVYAEFNHEKYYLKQIPTSSYDNADVMYKHEVTLVSERVILDNVYFFDVVTGNPSESDKPVSNSTKVTFFGGIRDFASRLNASLEYSGLDYEVVVDDEITTEEKLMSFEDQFFSNVLQAIYNTYEVPYYFDGKTIHIGYAKSDVIVPDLSYGVDNALLSISKNNANYKTVNRATGYGSSDNLTFYYPNNSPKGDITFEVNATGENLDVSIVDYERYSDKVGIDEAATFVGNHCEVTATYVGDSDSFVHTPYNEGAEYRRRAEYKNGSYRTIFRKVIQADGETKINFTTFFSLLRIDEWINSEAEYKKVEGDQEIKYHATVRFSHKGEVIETHTDVEDGSSFVFPVHERGSYFIDTEVVFIQPYSTSGAFNHLYGVLKYHSFVNVKEGWFLGGQSVELKDIGIHCEGTPTVGDTITQRLARYVNTSKNLMPSIYRQSDAKERFYNAVNYPFPFVEGYELKYGEYVVEDEGNVHNDAYKNEDGTYIHFDYPYVEGKAKEHIVAVEDLKPTIEKAVNSMGLRMDMFSEFAYDDDDSDETEENEDGSDRDFVHSYFFAKLRKLDFNLFECAIEQQPMTISFTSGDCGACNFEIGVTEEFPQKNPVMVNPDGTLMRDANGRVVCGQFEPIYENEIQDRQQDTINNEVWIALKKEEDTYGELMPKAPVNGVGGHRPKACSEGSNDGDTFVILGINLPEEYVTRQERQLEKEIIKYIKDNNEEKFTFSIGFSRIYFAENENILKNLSENSKVRIFYNNLPYDLYVSSFSYNLNAGDVLPDIKIELDETLKISQNPIQKAISQVKSQLGNALRNIDVVGAGTPYFLRKDVDDEVIGRVNFRKGVKFGEGGKVEVLDNNSAKLTIEYLEVTKKASFTSLEIQEKTHVGGQILVTPAAINCGEVEEFEGFYRCYFQTKGVEGDEIFNQFTMDDQAICQTYNTWGSRYYWRKVVGVGEDYIDLSKVAGEYDEDSDIPMAGDKIIQLGNQSDATRQNAIVIAAYGDGSPYIIQYKGINSFEISDDKIVTKLSSTENIFTGKVHMEMGSDGLENIDGGIGGQNMLRNSGFTGDYLSAQIADEIVLNAIDELFNPPFAHWKENNAVVYDSEVAASGKEVQISDGGDILQTLYQKVLENESYVVSFKAKGTSLTIKVGEVSETISLTNEWQKYSISIVASNTSEDFGIINATCSICDLQLERGTIATSWGRSFLDNSSDRAYYQARKYLDDAIKGFTDVSGGLILTGHIKVGEQSEGVMTEETGGINGIYNDDNDVAFWAGGSDAQAITSVSKYKDQPTYQPTEEELATMAKFVVTHGGRAILEDAIVRGTIYAKDGMFTGTVNATSGEFNNVDVQTGKIADFNINGNSLGIQEEVGGNGMSLYNKYISFYENNTQEKTELLARIGAYEGADTYQHVAEFENKSTNILDSMGGTGFGVCSDVSGYTNSYAFASKKGVFAGFRPHVAILGSSNDSPLQLGKYHHTILAWYGGTIVLDGTPENGQEYEIICPNTSVEEGRVQIITYDGTKKNIYLMLDGIERSGFSVYDLGGTRHVVKLVYFAQNDTWFAWHHSY